MRVLVIGGNSYIARAFARYAPAKWECSLLSRNDALKEYQELPAETFQGYDAVLNCTAIVHRSDPGEELSKRINTELPAYLALRAKEAGVSHFIHLSTIAVYGSQTHITGATPELPNTRYGQSKLEGDRRLLSLANGTFTVSVLRPPMVYGPDAPGNFHSLVRLIRRVPILPLGYTANRRSFIGIDNLVHALRRVLETKTAGVLLVCDAQHPSLAEFSSSIAGGMGIRRLFFSPPTSLIRWLCRFPSLPFAKLYGTLIIDDMQTRSLLGDYAHVPLSEGVRCAVQGEWS